MGNLFPVFCSITAKTCLHVKNENKYTNNDRHLYILLFIILKTREKVNQKQAVYDEYRRKAEKDGRECFLSICD